MAVDTLPVSIATYHPASRPRWMRRLLARYRLWRMKARRDIYLTAVDRRLRADIGRPMPKRYRWLDELMRAPGPH